MHRTYCRKCIGEKCRWRVIPTCHCHVWIRACLCFAFFSFFGAFEIVLPASLANRADKEADKGGYYGAFFMALTLAIVSFSCTGPIVGNVLVKSAGGELFQPAIAMFGFGLAFALPFTLF